MKEVKQLKRENGKLDGLKMLVMMEAERKEAQG